MARSNSRTAGNCAVNAVRYIIAAALLLLLAVSVREHLTAPREEPLFPGKGTREDPYRISSAEDLALLAETVNAGTAFEGSYFIQTQDLDLAGYESWTPIGTYGDKNYFAGYYNGGGHVISNLTILGDRKSAKGNVGLFGCLSGVVYNLGIESGHITGACVGSITSHSSSNRAMIVNCYSKASLEGSRCGGIADNFSNGKIICCWNAGELNGNTVGAITSYGTATVFGCAGFQDLLSESFTGDMAASEVCTQVDPVLMQQNLKEAQRRFDLQYLGLTEVGPAGAAAAGQ